MTKQQKQKGFTLVELAIVLTIIGLLIGGILKGQQLMQNARVTATMAQVNAIEAATTTFRDTYNALPGDMANANVRVPNCGNCGFGGAVTTAGDGIVGIVTPAWNLNTPQQGTNINAAPTVPAQETILFWAELAQAGLLSGITNDGITNTNVPTFGTSLPSARIGGGWVIGNSSGGPLGVSAGPRPAGSPFVTMAGTVIVLASSPTAVMTGNTGTNPLAPATAAQMDRKQDDGEPTSGFVQAYGTPLNCFSVAVPFSAASPGYLESSTSKDCGLIFRIQG